MNVTTRLATIHDSQHDRRLEVDLHIGEHRADGDAVTFVAWDAADRIVGDITIESNPTLLGNATAIVVANWVNANLGNRP